MELGQMYLEGANKFRRMILRLNCCLGFSAGNYFFKIILAFISIVLNGCATDH